jgi:hypothetical protein
MAFAGLVTLPDPPANSLFLPHPVNLFLTTNTFVRFHVEDGTERVGLVVQLNTMQQSVLVRLFLNWQQLVDVVGPDKVSNVSFWARRNASTHPIPLCDSDILLNVALQAIIGFAFVFHAEDSILQQLAGMQDTYSVSSLYVSKKSVIYHCRSFHPFPSSYFPALPTCCPSMIFEQLMRLRNKVQGAMNTNSMRWNDVQVVQSDNFSNVTWLYMTKGLGGLGIPLINSLAVARHVYMEGEVVNVRKSRVAQQSFSLYLPEHYVAARNIFGSSAGLGVRVIIPCSLRNVPRSEAAESTHVIGVGDVLNVVPFVAETQPHVLQRGFTFKYVVSSSLLTVTIRYFRVHNLQDVKRHFRLRRIPVEDDSELSDMTEEGDVWPLHHDSDVFGSRIEVIQLNNEAVTLLNGVTCSIDEVIAEFQRQI